MKISKISAAVAAFALVSGFAFADSEVKFSNKVSSDIVEIVSNDDDTETEFAGIKNKTVFEYASDNLDAMIELVFWSKKETDEKDPLDADDDKDYFAIGTGGFDFGDTFIEFRPFEVLGFEFHEKLNTAGSYLPVWDDNLSTGNMGSDFGVVVRPVEGLVFGAGVDFMSAFGHDDRKPIFNFGVEYANEDFAIGGALRNVAGDEDEDTGTDELAFGVYTSLIMVENFSFNLGFAYNDAVEPDVGTVDGNLLTAGIMFEKDAVTLNVDAATNFGNSDDKEFDLYSAVQFGFAVNDNFSAELTFANALDFESDDDKKEKAMFEINPAVKLTFDRHEFGAGVNVFFNEDGSKVCFPVHWKYSF